MGLSDASLHMLTSHEKRIQSIQTSISESHSLSNYRLVRSHFPLTSTSTAPVYHHYLLASQTQRFAFLLEHPKEAILTLTSSPEHGRLGFTVIWFSLEGMKGEYSAAENAAANLTKSATQTSICTTDTILKVYLLLQRATLPLQGAALCHMIQTSFSPEATI